MKQHNQIGNRIFVTPNNKQYIFGFTKHGNRYIFIIEYKGYKMHIPESDFNKTDIDTLLNTMEEGIKII